MAQTMQWLLSIKELYEEGNIDTMYISEGSVSISVVLFVDICTCMSPGHLTVKFWAVHTAHAQSDLKSIKGYKMFGDILKIPTVTEDQTKLVK